MAVGEDMYGADRAQSRFIAEPEALTVTVEQTPDKPNIEYNSMNRNKPK